VRSTNLIRHARGVDLLVHDVLAAHVIESLGGFLSERGAERLARLTGDIVEYHASPADAAAVGREAGARMVVFTHMVPPVPSMLASRIFLHGIEDTSSPQIVLGQDGMHFTMPPGSTEILSEDLD